MGATQFSNWPAPTICLSCVSMSSLRERISSLLSDVAWPFFVALGLYEWSSRSVIYVVSLFLLLHSLPPLLLPKVITWKVADERLLLLMASPYHFNFLSLIVVMWSSNGPVSLLMVTRTDYLLRGLHERGLGRFGRLSFLITWILRCKSVVNIPDSQAYLKIEKANTGDCVIFDLRQRFLSFWMLLSFATAIVVFTAPEIIFYSRILYTNNRAKIFELSR